MLLKAPNATIPTNPASSGHPATVAVTDADFAERVLRADRTVLVDFWAPWCPPCRMIAPVLEQIAAEHADRLTVAKINTDENPSTGAACGVLAVPTLQVYRDGQLVRSLVGARSKARLLAELEDVLQLG
ncbi:thioredoxin [Actinopolymorpha pittospori]